MRVLILVLAASIVAAPALADPPAPGTPEAKAAFAPFTQALDNQLKDYSTAHFRNVHLYRGDMGPALCGEINAKNSMGGYTGWHGFELRKGFSGLVLVDAQDPGDCKTLVFDVDMTPYVTYQPGS